MKLLIVTQVVDSNHSVLGFFHHWIEEFANHCDAVHVTCLEVGEHSLPVNVHVHSLGKEKGVSRLIQLLRFYKYVWLLRNEYDAVFVHMNPIYVVLGGVLWRVLGKKISLWYTHGTVTLQLRVATFLTHIIFTASEESFRINSKKKHVVGHGIDTELFKPQTSNLKPPTLKQDLRLVSLGRISRIKRQDLAVRTLAEIRARNTGATLVIIGTPLTSGDQEYQNEIRDLVTSLGLVEHVRFLGAVPNTELPKLLQESDVLIHTSETGSLDKVILEAFASGVLVVTTSSVIRKVLPLSISESSFSNNSPSDIARCVQNLARGDIAEIIHETRTYIIKNHSLQGLIGSIVSIMKQ